VVRSLFLQNVRLSGGQTWDTGTICWVMPFSPRQPRWNSALCSVDSHPAALYIRYYDMIQEAQRMLRECDMRAVGHVPQKCKTPHFPYPLVFLGRIQDHRILRSGSASTAKILSCANFKFLSHYVITIHQRYRQTDRRTSCS